MYSIVNIKQLLFCIPLYPHKEYVTSAMQAVHVHKTMGKKGQIGRFVSKRNIVLFIEKQVAAELLNRSDLFVSSLAK